MEYDYQYPLSHILGWRGADEKGVKEACEGSSGARKRDLFSYSVYYHCIFDPTTSFEALSSERTSRFEGLRNAIYQQSTLL